MAGSEAAGDPGKDVRELSDALASGHKHQAWALLQRLHPADAADLLAALDGRHRPLAIEALGIRLEPRILSYLDDGIRREVFSVLGMEAVADALAALESDDAVDLLADLPELERGALLTRIPPARRELILQALSYANHSAGRLMQSECAVVPRQWTVGQSLDYLQRAPEMPSGLHAVFVVDDEGRAEGVVALEQLVRARRSERIADLLGAEPHAIFVRTHESEVARRFRRYGLISAPVVDANRRILGQITLDDVLDVIEPSDASVRSVHAAAQGLIGAAATLMKNRPAFHAGLARIVAAAVGLTVLFGMILWLST